MNTVQPTSCFSPLVGAGNWIKANSGAAAANLGETAKTIGTAVVNFFTKIAGQLMDLLRSSKDTLSTNFFKAKDAIAALPPEAKWTFGLSLLVTAAATYFSCRCCAKETPVSPVVAVAAAATPAAGAPANTTAAAPANTAASQPAAAPEQQQTAANAVAAGAPGTPAPVAAPALAAAAATPATQV